MRIFKKLKEKVDHVEKKTKPKQIIEKDKRKQTVVITYAIFFCVLFCSIGAIVLSLQTAGKSTEINQQKEIKAKDINYPAIQSFLNPFVDNYINVNSSAEKKDERKKRLQSTMVISADYSNSFSIDGGEGERLLNHKELYSIKETKSKTYLVQYKVNYTNRTFTEKEITKTEGTNVIKQKVKEPKENQKTALLNIEIVQKEDVYAVNSLPYFTDVYNLQATVDKSKEANFDSYQGENEKEIIDFLNDFLKKYAESNSKDMAYMMKEPEGLNNALSYDRMDKYELYQKSGDIIVVSQLVFLEPDTKINVVEDFEITLTKKDSHYYVEKMEHK
ncbi:conjugal transfer protein [Listeria monocytogenes]|nr:conjugal transfer protein [Listeria monocytogenes]EEU7817554.1 conjugal transfer protein [Listeria monocytogenes]